MKHNKKGQQAAAGGFGTIVNWAIVIGIAILLIIIMIAFTDPGKAAWARITNAFAFV